MVPVRQEARAESDRDVHHLLKSVAGMVGGAGFTAVANFVLVVVLTRMTDAATVGTVMALTSLFLIAVVVSRMGTPSGLVFFISRARALSAPTDITRAIGHSIVPVVSATLIVATAVWAHSGTLAGWVGGPDEEGAQRAIQLMMLVVPFAAGFEIATAVLEGFRKMRPTALLDRVVKPLAQVAFVVVVAAPGALVALTLAWSLPYVPVFLAAVFWGGLVVRAATRPALSRNVADRSLTRRQYWRFTTPRWLSSILQVSLQRLDIFLVAALAGPVEAAIYATATRAIVVGQMVQQSIGQVVQPWFGAALAARDLGHAQAIYTVSTSWLIYLTWPIFLAASVLSVPFLRVFGDEYTQGWPVIVILSVALMVATSSGTVDIVLTMAGRSSTALVNALVAFVVLVALDFWLVPLLGAVGAALGWAAAILVRTVLPLAQVLRETGLHPYHPPTWRAAGWTLGCMGVVPVIAGVLGSWTTWWLTGGIVLGGLMLCGYVFSHREPIMMPLH